MWCYILMTQRWAGWAGGLREFDPSLICKVRPCHKETQIGWWVMVAHVFNPSF